MVFLYFHGHQLVMMLTLCLGAVASAWYHESLVNIHSGLSQFFVPVSLTLFPPLFISCPLGQVFLIRPIGTLVCSPQSPNQRRWWNQWGEWILTGIWNEHQPLGSMCLRPCVCLYARARWAEEVRPSPGQQTLSAWAALDHFWEMMEGEEGGGQKGC